MGSSKGAKLLAGKQHPEYMAVAPAQRKGEWRVLACTGMGVLLEGRE